MRSTGAVQKREHENTNKELLQHSSHHLEPTCGKKRSREGVMCEALSSSFY
jgi:hypothetical protein